MCIRDSLEAPRLPCNKRMASAPIRRIRDAAVVVGGRAEEDEDIAPGLPDGTGIGLRPPRYNRGADDQHGDPVSYTHLDVYKRQKCWRPIRFHTYA